MFSYIQNNHLTLEKVKRVSQEPADCEVTVNYVMLVQQKMGAWGDLVSCFQPTRDSRGVTRNGRPLSSFPSMQHIPILPAFHPMLFGMQPAWWSPPIISWTTRFSVRSGSGWSPLHCERNFTCKNILVMNLQKVLSCNPRNTKGEFLSSTSHLSLLTNQERGISKKRPTHSRQVLKAGKGKSPQMAAFSPAAEEANVISYLSLSLLKLTC